MNIKIPALSAKICGKGYMSEDNTLLVGESEGEYAILRGVDFGTGKKGFNVTYSWSEGGVSLIEIRLDSLTGKSIGVCACTTINETHTVGCEIEKTVGIHDVYLVFHRKGKNLSFELLQKVLKQKKHIFLFLRKI